MTPPTLGACRHTDPEPLKRLKREMRVALKEEDYAAGKLPLSCWHMFCAVLQFC